MLETEYLSDSRSKLECSSMLGKKDKAVLENRVTVNQPVRKPENSKMRHSIPED